MESKKGEVQSFMQKRLRASEEIIDYLKSADPILAGVIDRYGVIDYALSDDFFVALLSNVVGQQLSGKVADVIWKRFEALFDGEITTQKILALDDEQLRAVGLSKNKASYIKNIARAVEDGTLTINELENMQDEQIIEQLTKVKGIGRWTAEMLLIFSLGRQNVFSEGDGGLKNALKNLYTEGTPPTKEQTKTITKNYDPYKTYASLYLWRSLDNK